MKRIATLTALTAAAALTAGQASAVEIAVNGGFETGDFTGWTDNLSSKASIENTGSFDGNFHAKINNDSPTQGEVIKNAFLGAGTLIPGSEVTVSFWARGSAPVGGVHFAELISEFAGPGGTNEILGGGPLFSPGPAGEIDVQEWTKFEFTTNLGADVAGGVTLQFNAATGPNPGTILEVDNVSVDVVPEPSSLALLGLGGLAALRRRRR